MIRALTVVAVLALVLSLAGCPKPESTEALAPGPAGPMDGSADGAPGFSDAVEQLDELAPDFTLLDTEGVEVTKNDYSGKVLILDFWATFCKPCVKNLSAYEPILEKYADKGAELLAVSMDSKPEVAAGWAKKQGFGFRIAMIDDEFKAAYFPGESMIVIPQVRIIDRDGNLRFAFSADSVEEDLELALAQLVEETVGGDEEITREVLSEIEEPEEEPSQEAGAADEG